MIRKEARLVLTNTSFATTGTLMKDNVREQLECDAHRRMCPFLKIGIKMLTALSSVALIELVRNVYAGLKPVSSPQESLPFL